MPWLQGGDEDDSKRCEDSLRGKGGASTDGGDERCAYLRSDVVDGSGRRRLLVCEGEGSYGGSSGGA
jgi:hypothetical protein